MIELDYDVKLITRAEWGARHPRSVTGLVAGKVTSHWEGPHMGSFPHSSCYAKVRGIQAFHMDSRGWSDIAYNGVACPHGFVFEGRGYQVRSAANGTTAGNSGAYAICYLGGQDDGFTEAGERAMKAGGNWLTWAGSSRNCHSDWKSTECPGDGICSWTHDGQPIVVPGPGPLPPVLLLEKNMRTFSTEGNITPWVAVSDNGTVVFFTATPEMAQPFMGAGDVWAPNGEWHAAAQAGVIDTIDYGGPVPQKWCKTHQQFNEALALVRRARAVN